MRTPLFTAALLALLWLLDNSVGHTAPPKFGVPWERPLAPKQKTEPRLISKSADDGQFRQIVFTKDGKRLFTSGSSCRIGCWDTETGKLAFSFGGRGEQLLGYFALSSDETTLVVSGARKDAKQGEQEIGVYNLGTKQLTHRFEPPNDLGRPFFLTPDGKQLILGGIAPAQPEIVDLKTGNQVKVIGAKRNAVMMAPSKDGRWLAIAPNRKGGRMIVWDLKNDKIHHELTEFVVHPGAFAFSPDGKELAVALGAGLLFYTLDDKKCEKSFCLDLYRIQSGVWAISYSPDGKLLAIAGGDPGVVLWDLQAKKIHADFLGTTKRECHAVAFSPDGKTLAVASGVGKENHIHFFDVPPLKKEAKKDK